MLTTLTSPMVSKEGVSFFMPEERNNMKTKIIQLLLAILIFGFGSMQVQAISIEEKASTTNIKIKKDGKEIKLYHYSSSEENHIYNYDWQYKKVYSTDNFLDYHSQVQYALNLEDEIWNRMELLIYYGYGYDRHLEEKWYYITQYLLWQTLYPNSNWSIEMKEESPYHFQKEVDEMETLIKEHQLLPSFTEDYIFIDEKEDATIELKDEYHVLKDYHIYGGMELEVDISSKEDTLILRRNPIYPWVQDVVYLEFTKSAHLPKYIKLFSTENHKLLARGGYIEPRIQIPVYVGGATITIPDQGNHVIYDIYDNAQKKVGSIAEGTTSKKLPYGDYILQVTGELFENLSYPVTLTKEEENYAFTEIPNKKKGIITIKSNTFVEGISINDASGKKVANLHLEESIELPYGTYYFDVDPEKYDIDSNELSFEITKEKQEAYLFLLKKKELAQEPIQKPSTENTQELLPPSISIEKENIQNENNVIPIKSELQGKKENDIVPIKSELQESHDEKLEIPEKIEEEKQYSDEKNCEEEFWNATKRKMINFVIVIVTLITISLIYLIKKH